MPSSKHSSGKALPTRPPAALLANLSRTWEALNEEREAVAGELGAVTEITSNRLELRRRLPDLAESLERLRAQLLQRRRSLDASLRCCAAVMAILDIRRAGSGVHEADAASANG